MEKSDQRTQSMEKRHENIEEKLTKIHQEIDGPARSPVVPNLPRWSSELWSTIFPASFSALLPGMHSAGLEEATSLVLWMSTVAILAQGTHSGRCGHAGLSLLLEEFESRKRVAVPSCACRICSNAIWCAVLTCAESASPMPPSLCEITNVSQS